MNKPNQKEFCSIITVDKLFSVPKELQGAKLSAIEREKQIIEDRRREYETWKSKLKVDSTFVKVNTIVKDRPLQLDKVKGIRADKPVKKGLLLKTLKMK